MKKREVYKQSDLALAIKAYRQWVDRTAELVAFCGGGYYALGNAERQRREDVKRSLLGRVKTLVQNGGENEKP